MAWSQSCSLTLGALSSPFICISCSLTPPLRPSTPPIFQPLVVALCISVWRSTLGGGHCCCELGKESGFLCPCTVCVEPSFNLPPGHVDSVSYIFISMQSRQIFPFWLIGNRKLPMIKVAYFLKRRGHGNVCLKSLLRYVISCINTTLLVDVCKVICKFVKWCSKNPVTLLNFKGKLNKKWSCYCWKN